MRPPLQSKSTPIPAMNLKEKDGANIIDRQIKALKVSRDALRKAEKERTGTMERTGKLRIIDNIQLVKPREKVKEEKRGRTSSL